MKLPLSEIVRLKAQIGYRIGDLSRELHQVSVLEVTEEERNEGNYETHDRSVEDVLADIEDARNDELIVSEILSRANLEHTITWDGKDIPLGVGITKSKQLRGQLSTYKDLASRKKERKQGSYLGGGGYEIAQFEPKEYKQKTAKLERQVFKLSSELNRANATIEKEVEIAEKYI